MIKIRYSKGENLAYHHLLIRGHAQAAPSGHDIVCAGVSAIAFALLAYLEQNAEHDTYPPEIEPGTMDIFVVQDDEGIRAAFEMAILGLEQIANHYPQYVEITYLCTSADDTREQTPR